MIKVTIYMLEGSEPNFSDIINTPGVLRIEFEKDDPVAKPKANKKAKKAEEVSIDNSERLSAMDLILDQAPKKGIVFTTKQAAEWIAKGGYKESYVSQTLNALVKEKCIERISKGQYAALS